MLRDLDLDLGLGQDHVNTHLPENGAQPPIFGLCLLWLNGNQHVTWYGGSSPQKKEAPPPFLAHVYCGQTAGWIKMTLGMEVGIGPGHIALDGDPVPLHRKGAQPVPNFRPMSVVGKRLDGSACHLARR